VSGARSAAWRVAALTLMLLLPGIGASFAGGARKVLVLGVDGLDPKILQGFMDQGLLPNFSKLAAAGDFKPLGTSMPPLSPIAWSTFITGMDPGGHGIYDFVHRDPATIIPTFAMVEAAPPGPSVKIGSFVMPLGLPGKAPMINLRQGAAFWQILEQEADVPTTIFRMPANFPPSESDGRAFSGMGTPDIQGTPGMFSFYTDRFIPNAGDIGGGDVYPVKVDDLRVDAKLIGPKNTMIEHRKDIRRGAKPRYANPDLEIPFTVHLDPERPVAKIEIRDASFLGKLFGAGPQAEFILQEGEWSPWIGVQFEAIPVLGSISAIGRFYLRQVRPYFELYVTPLQITPENPAMPISVPESWANELYRELGPFYTQELPADTKALTAGLFTGHEFWEQTQFVYSERRRALDYFLDTFEEGFLFFYFTSVDQGSHMMWRYQDPDHPAYEQDPVLSKAIETLYRQIDEALGRTMASIDDETTLIVMSDHGFCPFYRGVNLNTWLLENGYVTLRDPSRQGKQPMFLNVDWSKTTAYAVGLNGIYVNLKGREKRGTVTPGPDYDMLLDRLEKDLLAMRDPANDQPAVTLVTRVRWDFHGDHLEGGPDIIVGYNWGYRSSWKNPLGEFPKEIFVENDEAWSGDHAVDYRKVPGVLITNRKITIDHPSLPDLTVSILDEYGIPKPETMIGRDCLDSGRAPAP